MEIWRKRWRRRSRRRIHDAGGRGLLRAEGGSREQGVHEGREGKRDVREGREGGEGGEDDVRDGKGKVRQ